MVWFVRSLVVVMTASLFSAAVLYADHAREPDSHVRLPDRGSTLTASPVRHLEEAAAWVVGIRRAKIVEYLSSLQQVEQQNAEAALQPPARAQRAVSAPPEDVVPEDPATGDWTVWDWQARCETGGDWSMQGSSYSGGLGFANGSWDAYGGQEFAPNAGMATREEQIVVAERIQDTPPVNDADDPCVGW